MPKPRAKRRDKETKRHVAPRRAPRVPPPAVRALTFKVVELSNVDEATIERTINEWVPQGWQFDGVQFAMRESSRRPAMAFVFFTREGAPVTDAADGGDGYREAAAAQAHFERIVLGAPAQQRSGADAWARLAALAEEGDE